jgi:3D (Asp-Asp-Asp) domain-containing protein
MCNLCQTVGIVCLATLLQLGVSAQNSSVNVSAQELNAKSSVATTSDSSDFDKPANVTSDAVNKTGSEASTPTATEPKVKIKNPALDLRETARATRLRERQFAAPDTSQLSEPLTFNATAYSLRGRTRMGSYVRRGVIAADPKVLPLGSVVQINAGKYSGVYSVHDTGKRIKGKIVDVWMPSNGEARQFGRRGVKIQVLRMGKGQRSNKK